MTVLAEHLRESLVEVALLGRDGAGDASGAARKIVETARDLDALFRVQEVAPEATIELYGALRQLVISRAAIKAVLDAEQENGEHLDGSELLLCVEHAEARLARIIEKRAA